mmetsp:Transcript_8651/g.24119  ORF Transcript_8651/g.24119 Transcript_8651/m.24119 type:complete len:129 (-) Transcript_8651:99-485(-)
MRCPAGSTSLFQRSTRWPFRLGSSLHGSRIRQEPCIQVPSTTSCSKVSIHRVRVCLALHPFQTLFFDIATLLFSYSSCKHLVLPEDMIVTLETVNFLVHQSRLAQTFPIGWSCYRLLTPARERDETYG